MRYVRLVLMVLLLAMPFLAGCSSNNKGKIEGTKWLSEKATIDGVEVPAGTGELKFSSDGGLAGKIVGQNKQGAVETLTIDGTYTLGLGNTVMFNLNKEIQGRKTIAENIVIDGDQLKMTDSEGTKTVPFKKEQ